MQIYNDIITLNTFPESEAHKNTFQKLRQLEEKEQKEFLNYISLHLRTFTDQCHRDTFLNLIDLACNHFQTAPEEIKGQQPRQGIDQALKQIKEQIFAASKQANKEQCVLLLKTAIAAIELSQTPTNIKTFEKFDDCYRKLKKDSRWYKITAAIQRFFAALIPALRPLAKARTARARLSDSFLALSQDLGTPNQLYTHPGQHQALTQGSAACVAVSLAMATELTDMSDENFSQLARGQANRKTVEQQFGDASRKGIKLHTSVDQGFFKRFLPRTPCQIHDYLKNKPSPQFQNINNLLKSEKTVHGNKPSWGKGEILDTGFFIRVFASSSRHTLDSILDKAESYSSNIAFSATDDGHAISFVSRQIGNKRMYAIMDSRHRLGSGKMRQGYVEFHDNRQSAAHSLLRKWYAKEKNTFIIVKPFDRSPKP